MVNATRLHRRGGDRGNRRAKAKSSIKLSGMTVRARSFSGQSNLRRRLNRLVHDVFWLQRISNRAMRREGDPRPRDPMLDSGPPRAPRPDSTPVGPPPTIRKVSRLCRSTGSSQASARSNAMSSRRRTSVASSTRFRPGAYGAHSSPEITVARARREHEIVVRHSGLPEQHFTARGVDAGHFPEQHARIEVLAK